MKLKKEFNAIFYLYYFIYISTVSKLCVCVLSRISYRWLRLFDFSYFFFTFNYLCPKWILCNSLEKLTLRHYLSTVLYIIIFLFFYSVIRRSPPNSRIITRINEKILVRFPAPVSGQGRDLHGSSQRETSGYCQSWSDTRLSECEYEFFSLKLNWRGPCLESVILSVAKFLFYIL